MYVVLCGQLQTGTVIPKCYKYLNVHMRQYTGEYKC